MLGILIVPVVGLGLRSCSLHLALLACIHIESYSVSSKEKFAERRTIGRSIAALLSIAYKVQLKICIISVSLKKPKERLRELISQ